MAAYSEPLLEPRSDRGWLPIDLGLDQQPAMISGSVVQWLDFGSAEFTEPFFEQTIDRLRASTPPAFEISTDQEALLRVTRGLPAVRPAGLIFHVSHCGSTLLANALKAGRDTAVISEASAMVALMRAYDPSPEPYLDERWGCIRRQLLESLCQLYAHHSTGHAQRLVLKFASINLHGMRLVRDYFPDTPCVVIVRDPAEVIVSSLGENGWMALKSESARAREIFQLHDLAGSSAELPAEEYCARVLGSLLASARDAVGPDCRVVDFEDLNAKRMRDIAVFFGIELPPDRESVDRVFHWYAKDPGQRTPYEDDRARKRRLTTPAIIAAARQWAMPAYADLRARDSGF